jgi:hypothetical protein
MSYPPFSDNYSPSDVRSTPPQPRSSTPHTVTLPVPVPHLAFLLTPPTKYSNLLPNPRPPRWRSDPFGPSIFTPVVVCIICVCTTAPCVGMPPDPAASLKPTEEQKPCHLPVREKEKGRLRRVAIVQFVRCVHACPEFFLPLRIFPHKVRHWHSGNININVTVFSFIHSLICRPPAAVYCTVI